MADWREAAWQELEAALATAAGAPGTGCRLRLSNEGATRALGYCLAAALGPGDAALLSGPLGAGKSALARAVIQARLADPSADVPSPSYTLVNVYETAAGLPIWHADLYRLGDPEELIEIGLEEAFADCIALIEWPERLENPPARRLEITLAPLPGAEETGRMAMITCRGAWPALSGLATHREAPGPTAQAPQNTASGSPLQQAREGLT
ncbi:MAG: tRNA (adenosine(37)-N6)-threonylcarbamoyltransferase complex ATPase subunit type 1 TsaE [Pseudomonadota bacterium]